LTAYYGTETGYTLTANGEWESNSPEGTAVIYLFGAQDPPAFVFETDEDGMIQKISFTVDRQTSKETSKEDRPWMSDYQTQMQMAALAFVGAQKEFPQFSSARRKMLETIANHVFEDYSFTQAGVTVTCDVEQQGYNRSVGLLIPSDEGECSFYLHFTMSIGE